MIIDDFAKLIVVPSSDVESLTAKSWDGRGKYKDVIDAVEKAADGRKATVYRVARGGVRVEYYVLAVNSEEGRLVGVQVQAVES